MLDTETGNLTDRGKEEMQVVAFRLNAEEYAVDILSVHEINKMLDITRVPRAPEYIQGVVNLRGNVIPVINLHQRFKLGEFCQTDDSRIIIFKHGDVPAAIMVDQVSEVLGIKTADIEKASQVYSSLDSELIQGVVHIGGRLLILLNLGKLLEE
ncbi:MAG: chemotaxis protein CheW [Syntrophothermaceae bacterium]